MRDYAKTSSKFWTGETGKLLRRLGRDHQVIGFYLFSCPNSNMIGLYYLPVPTLCHEVGGIDPEGALKVLRSLSEGGYAHYDEHSEHVYVPEMAYHQLGERLTRKDNRHKAVVKLLEQFRKIIFFNDFLSKYREAFDLAEIEPNKTLRSPSIAPSKPGAGAGERAGAGTGTGLPLSEVTPGADLTAPKPPGNGTDPPARGDAGLPDGPASESPPPTPPKPNWDRSLTLEEAQKLQRAYPVGIYRQSEWLVAEKLINWHLARGIAFETILASFERYRLQQEAKGNIGREFVQSPVKHCDRELPQFDEPFPLPRTKAEARQDANIDAGQQWLEESTRAAR